MRLRLNPLAPNGISIADEETKTVQHTSIGTKGADGADGLTVSVNSVTQVAGDISLTQDNIPDGTTNKAYTATEQSKLAGIEALADVTDTANVTSAGALMDSELSNIASVKALNQGVATTDSPTFNLPVLTGGLSLTGVTGSNITQISGATAQWSSFGNKLYFTNASFGANAGVNFGVNISDGAASETRFIIDRVSNSGAYSTNLFKLQTNTAVATFYGNVTPNADSSLTLGTSSLYWSNTYTDRLYLNSTAYLDGGTAGVVAVTGSIKENGNLIQRKTFVTVGTSDADYVTDGTSDNTEIQAAIDAVSTAGGGIVHLKKGTFTLAASIKPKSNIILEGEGTATVLTIPNATNIDIIDNHDQTNGNSYIVLRNFKVLGNGANQSSAVNGIHFKETDNCTIEGVLVSGTRGYGIYFEGESTSNRNVTDCRLINCTIEGVVDSTRDGLHAIYTTRLQVRGCIARSNGRHGLHINRSDYGTFVNCTTTLNGGDGYQLYIVTNCSFFNCSAISNTNEGYQLAAGSHYNTIQASSIISNGTYGILGGAASTQNEYNQFIGNQIISNGDDGLPIFYSNYAVATGNTIKGNADQGIAVDNSKHCVVSGNYIEGNKSEGIEVKNSSTDCVISNNIVKNNSNTAVGGTANALSGISIETGITDAVVTGNRCFDDQATKSQKYGIEMTGTADYCVVNSNNLRGNATDSLASVGANNVIADNLV